MLRKIRKLFFSLPLFHKLYSGSCSLFRSQPGLFLKQMVSLPGTRIHIGVKLPHRIHLINNRKKFVYIPCVFRSDTAVYFYIYLPLLQKLYCLQCFAKSFRIVA